MRLFCICLNLLAIIFSLTALTLGGKFELNIGLIVINTMMLIYHLDKSRDE